MVQPMTSRWTVLPMCLLAAALLATTACSTSTEPAPTRSSAQTTTVAVSTTDAATSSAATTSATSSATSPAAADAADFSDLTPTDVALYTAQGGGSLAGTRFETTDGRIACLFSPTQRYCTLATPGMQWRSGDQCTGTRPAPPEASSALGWLAFNGPACHWAYQGISFLDNTNGQWNVALAPLPVGHRLDIPLTYNPSPTSDRIRCGARTTGLTCVHNNTGFTLTATSYRTW